MPTPYYLRLAYVGTRFHGWQIQPQARTVQQVLWEAVRRFDPGAPLPQGTGRTDAGVHARAQGVLLRLGRTWDSFRLQAAVNAHLPEDVRVMAVQAVPEAFWPRHHAVAKRYVYRLTEGPSQDPFLRETHWHVRGAAPLDRERMAEASQRLLGCRDFAGFRHQDCAAASTVRTLHRITFVEDGPRLELHFEGDRFLMHQVRIMTGTLVDIGKGRVGLERILEPLATLDRRHAGHTAPPHGLCLEEVWYQPQWGVGDPSPWSDTRTP